MHKIQLLLKTKKKFFSLQIADDKVKPAVVYTGEYKRDKERFADYLIRKGVLSPKMLQELKNELLKSESNSLEEDSYEDTTKSRTSISKRRTKKRK